MTFSQGYVYLMHHDGLYKIGFARNPQLRREVLRATYPGIALVHQIATNAMRHLERQVHWHVRAYHVQDQHHDGDEWFALPPGEIEYLSHIKHCDLKPATILSYERGDVPLLPWRQTRNAKAGRNAWIGTRQDAR